jgi:hypothetical protein
MKADPTAEEIKTEMQYLVDQYRGSPGAAPEYGNQGGGQQDYDSMDEDMLYQLALEGDPEAQRIGMTKFGSQ